MFHQQSASGSGTRQDAQESENLQETTNDEIIILRRIGQGGFSEVSAGIWNKKTVAVKKFSSRHENHWRREIDNYKTPMIRHENILNFIGDLVKADVSIQLYIFTEYHPNGSLSDYLDNSTINTNDMFKMVMSIVAGLNYLHRQIVAQRKPAMAHRDIKSKNVLVKLDATCVIADLGQAVKQDPITKSVNEKANEPFGTVRYLSPEILEHKINHTIEDYQCADVYALALTMWEVVVKNSRGIHDQPFSGNVSPNPTIREMHQTICTNRLRPFIPPEWAADNILKSMGHLLETCWEEDPRSRPTVEIIKQSLEVIKEEGDIAEELL